MLQTHVAERPRGRACPVCSQLNRAGQRGGSGSSVPRPAVCVRASSHTSSNNGKKEVSTTTTQKAMRGPWTCGASKMGRNKRREGGGKNLGPSLIGEGGWCQQQSCSPHFRPQHCGPFTAAQIVLDLPDLPIFSPPPSWSFQLSASLRFPFFWQFSCPILHSNI